jgi:4-amino-4-deoxy-L-arabinose transferase-like glycosyltransferase
VRSLITRARATALRHEPLTAALLIFIVLAATIGWRPLLLPDEGRYVGVAWEMMRSGDWITPTLNGLPYFHKPPLFYWLSGGAMSLFGWHEWAARLPPLLGGWLGAFSTFLFVRRWCDPRSARIAVLALVLQPLFFVGSQFANLDMLVAGCITATIVLLAHAALSREAGLAWRGSLAAAYAAAAFGMLAKGLIGVVLPGLVVVVWLLWLRKPRALLRLLWVPGIAIFALLAGRWLVAMQLKFPEFFHYFIVVQHFERFADTGFNNVAPVWFYVALLALAWLPFAPWLFGLRQARSLAGPDESQHRSIRLLLVVWVVAITAFFSIPASKLVGYIFPVLPPIAVLLAFALNRVGGFQRRSIPLWRWVGPALAAIAGVALVVVLAVHPSKSSRPLALTLAAQRAPGEPVVMVKDYVFDLPVYARLKAPVVVVEDWAAPEARQRDTWRKELLDAGQFDPALAKALLLEPSALAPLLCASPPTWIVGTGDSERTFPYLSAARTVATNEGRVLWRIDPHAPAAAAALHCASNEPSAAAPKTQP